MNRQVKPRKKRRFYFAIVLLLIITAFGIFICDQTVSDAARGKLYSDPDEIPFNRVGLLLGTSDKIANGQSNPFYDYRIDAAVQLIQAKKIRYIIISGDNGRTEYNEPSSMRAALMSRGIDSSIIYLDYAGFRTFDSIKRLKGIFGQDSVTIISQQFHNERAIYLASKDGIHAIGFNARNVGAQQGLRTELREKIARVKVFLDNWFGTKPKYMGAKVIIPSM